MKLLPRVFDRSFWVLAALAAGAGTACWVVLGRDAFLASFGDDAALLLALMPKLGAAFLLGGFVQVLLRRDKVARLIGARSGTRGIAIAAGAGMVTPGGPMTSFPLVSALHQAGTGRAALIAYLTSWATMGLQRILVWEVPLMGVEFAALRFIASLPLPFVAGLVSRLLPADVPATDGDDAPQEDTRP